MIVNRPAPQLEALGMADAGARARAKLLESLPDQVRSEAESASHRFRFDPPPVPSPDQCTTAPADAVREATLVRNGQRQDFFHNHAG